MPGAASPGAARLMSMSPSQVWVAEKRITTRFTVPVWVTLIVEVTPVELLSGMASGRSVALTLSSVVPAGQAGTAQKIFLNTFSSAIMVRLHKVYGNLMVDVMPTILSITKTPAPNGLDGIDLSKLVRGESMPERVLLSDTWQFGNDNKPFSELVAALDGKHKVVLDRMVEEELEDEAAKRAGIAVTGESGAFTGSFGVPTDLQLGDYRLVVLTPGDAEHAPAMAE